MNTKNKTGLVRIREDLKKINEFITSIKKNRTEFPLGILIRSNRIINIKTVSTIFKGDKKWVNFLVYRDGREVYWNLGLAKEYASRLASAIATIRGRTHFSRINARKAAMYTIIPMVSALYSRSFYWPCSRKVIEKEVQKNIPFRDLNSFPNKFNNIEINMLEQYKFAAPIFEQYGIDVGSVRKFVSLIKEEEKELDECDACSGCFGVSNKCSVETDGENVVIYQRLTGE